MQDYTLTQCVLQSHWIGVGVERPAVAGPDPFHEAFDDAKQPDARESLLDDGLNDGLARRFGASGAIEQRGAKGVRLAGGELDFGQRLGVPLQQFGMRGEDAEDERLARRDSRAARDTPAAR